MQIRHLAIVSTCAAISVGGLLILLRPDAWAQVDTNEGGGEEYQRFENGDQQNQDQNNQEQDNGRQEESDDLEARIRSLEAFRTLSEEGEAEEIKEQRKFVQWIEYFRRKTDDLERRVKMLESLQNKAGDNGKQAPKTQKHSAEPPNNTAADRSS